MTGKLTLRIGAGPRTEVFFGAVVSLRRVPTGDAARNEAVTSRVDVSLTPEQARNGREIEIPSGRWYVEATFGSGDVVGEMVDLREEASEVVVLPLSDVSPHGWLDWQFNNGNIEGKASLDRLTAQAREMTRRAEEQERGRARSRLLRQRLKESAKSGAARLARGLYSLRGRFDPDGSISRVIEAVQAELRRAASDTNPVVKLTNDLRLSTGGVDAWMTLLAEPTKVTTIADPIRSSPEEKLFVYHFDGDVPFGSRRFVEIIWNDNRLRLILPDRWSRISDGRSAGTELLVRRYPLDDGLKASVAVLDPDFAMLSALMMTSAMPKAAVFVDENADRIFASGSLAGAAAAYVVLASGRVEGRVLDHIRKFERSGAYPDCLALAAWRMIRFPERNQDARSAALGAFRAGPPFFSFGVAWILYALTMLGPDDPEALQYAEIVRRVAIRLDTSQVFTTVRL